MLVWLAANGGTILVLCVLLAVVAAIMYTMRRDRRQGKNGCGVKCGCGGSCSGCTGCGGSCHG